MTQRGGVIATWGVIALYLAVSATTLGMPPLGRDSWRESDVLGVGRNYCTEQASFLEPRIDARGDTSGITGMEFPLLNYLHGLAACAGLDQVVFARLLTLCLSLLGALAFVGLARGALDSSRLDSGTLGSHDRATSASGDAQAPVLALGVYLFSPLTLYYGRAIQPDVPALALVLLALYLLQRYAARRSRLVLAASAVALSLGILIKLPVIVFGLPALFLLLDGRPLKALLRPRYALYLAATVGPAAAWYVHARQLQVRYGLTYFYLGKSLTELFGDWCDPLFYRSVAGKMLDVYAFPLVAVLLLPILVALWPKLPGWIRALAVATLAYIFLAAGHIAHHNYYGIPVVPLLALVAGFGWSHFSPRLAPKTRAAVLALLLLGVVVHSVYRTERSWPRPEAQAELTTARRALDGREAAEQRAVYFSAGDPTLVWQLGRKGWLEQVDACDGPLTLHGLDIVVVDRNRIALGCPEQIRQQLEREGFTTLVDGPRALVIVRSRS